MMNPCLVFVLFVVSPLLALPSGNKEGDALQRDRRGAVSRMGRWCRKYYGTDAVSLAIAKCNEIRCSYGGQTKSYDGYYVNQCEYGEVCEGETCVVQGSETSPASGIRISQMAYAKDVCLAKGSDHKVLCEGINILMHPGIASKCQEDMCKKTYCIYHTAANGFVEDNVVPADETACMSGMVCRSGTCVVA